MDQYTENRALYPNAEFSFVGHSNGTYLLAKALDEYAACKFKHVIFAGSVVPTRFNCAELIKAGRIKKFYNFVASSDWVVAMFPKTFQRLSFQDLGSGGFDGFTADMGEPYQLKYVKGSHGAATKEIYWDEIAHFIVHGKFSASVGEMATPRRSLFMKTLGAIAPIPFFLVLAIVVFIAWAITQTGLSSPWIIGLLALYFYTLWKVVKEL